jgi:hypothetical protein
MHIQFPVSERRAGSCRIFFGFWSSLVVCGGFIVWGPGSPEAGASKNTRAGDKSQESAVTVWRHGSAEKVANNRAGQ